LSPYEQYILHLKTWTGDFHLSFDEVEKMPLEILFDLELVDSKVQAAFEEQRGNTKKSPPKRGRSIEYYI